MLLRHFALDTSILTEDQLNYYVQLTRAVYLFNMCINKATVNHDCLTLYSKRNKKGTFATKTYSFFESDDPDYETCTVEVASTDTCRFLKLNLFEHSFEVASVFRPSHNLSANDYEFLIAATVITSWIRPNGDNRGTKEQIMGEIYDFIGDYAV